MSENQPVSDLAAATVEAPAQLNSIEEQAAAILREASSPPKQVPEAGPSEEPKPAEALDLKTAAERLGVDPETLYGLKVAIAEGQEATLGELKDQWKDKASLEAERSAELKKRADWEADRIRAEREFQQVLEAQFGQGPPEQRQQALKQYQDFVKSREREALLRAVPEWVDPRIEQAERAEIFAVMKAEGFIEDEWNSTVDHRALKLLRRLVKAEARVKELTPKAEPKVAVKPKPGAGLSEAQRFGQLKAQVTKGVLRPEEAATRLLQGLRK